ncbi:MAG: sodium/proton-translocating pyrophosphatase, partial [Pirellulales bacterium]|nr:sodium/proton-translocating pyrophosphatase [Pirellulales bacterium]
MKFDRGIVRGIPAVLAAILVLLGCCVPAMAAPEGETAAATAANAATTTSEALFFVFWAIAFIGALTALGFAIYFFKKVMDADEGNEEMIEIASHVREGAAAYIWQQYKVVAIFFVIICGLLSWMAFGLHVQSQWVPFAFLTGGFFSGLAG